MLSGFNNSPIHYQSIIPSPDEWKIVVNLASRKSMPTEQNNGNIRVSVASYWLS